MSVYAVSRHNYTPNTQPSQSSSLEPSLNQTNSNLIDAPTSPIIERVRCHLDFMGQKLPDVRDMADSLVTNFTYHIRRAAEVFPPISIPRSPSSLSSPSIPSISSIPSTSYDKITLHNTPSTSPLRSLSNKSSLPSISNLPPSSFSPHDLPPQSPRSTSSRPRSPRSTSSGSRSPRSTSSGSRSPRSTSSGSRSPRSTSSGSRSPSSTSSGRRNRTGTTSLPSLENLL